MKGKLIFIVIAIISLAVAGYALYSSYNLVFSKKSATSSNIEITSSVSSEASITSTTSSEGIPVIDQSLLNDANNKINSFSDYLATFDATLNFVNSASTSKADLLTSINDAIAKVNVTTSNISSMPYISDATKASQIAALGKVRTDLINFQTQITNTNDTTALSDIKTQIDKYYSTNKDLIKNSYKDAIFDSTTTLEKTISEYKKNSNDNLKYLNAYCVKYKTDIDKAGINYNTILTNDTKLAKDLKAKDIPKIKADIASISVSSQSMANLFTTIRSSCDKD